MEVAAADRFAGWPHNAARAMLVVLLAVLVVSALVPITRGAVAGKSSAAHGGESGAAPIRTKARDDDLRVYDNVIARIRAGESYYSAVVAEHRAIGFPLQPGLAVRLPTLAYIEASLGRRGEWIAAVLLLAAVLIAWWRRLGTEPGSAGLRLVAIALLAANAALGLNAHFFRLHELWAGMLLALSFGLHRPHRWGWSWAVAGLALAIRDEERLDRRAVVEHANLERVAPEDGEPDVPIAEPAERMPREVQAHYIPGGGRIDHAAATILAQSFAAEGRFERAPRFGAISAALP